MASGQIVDVAVKPRSVFDTAFEGVDIATLSAKGFFDILEGIMYSPEGEKRAMSFQPRPSDVLTVTQPKTGQTWLLAMLRKLSLGKSYTVIDEKLATTMSSDGDGVPWMEHAIAGTNIHAEQPGSFRVYKSHLRCSQTVDMITTNPETKFITCLRQPHDVALSFFKHMRGMYVDRVCKGDAAPFDAAFSANDFAALDKGYEQNLVDWLSLRDRPNVMVLFYEETLADPAAALRRIANFVGAELDAELEEQTLQSTSYEVMSNSKAFANVFPGGGVYGKGRQTLNEAASEEIDNRWEQVVKPATGASSYEELFEQIHQKAFPFPR